MKKKLSKYVKAIISYTLFILCKELFFFSWFLYMTLLIATHSMGKIFVES